MSQLKILSQKHIGTIQVKTKLFKISNMEECP